MHDADTLTNPIAQVVRARLVAAVAPYRAAAALAPVPSYLHDAIADTIRALDRWTAESERARRVA